VTDYGKKAVTYEYNIAKFAYTNTYCYSILYSLFPVSVLDGSD